MSDYGGYDDYGGDDYGGGDFDRQSYPDNPEDFNYNSDNEEFMNRGDDGYSQPSYHTYSDDDQNIEQNHNLSDHGEQDDKSAIDPNYQSQINKMMNTVGFCHLYKEYNENMPIYYTIHMQDKNIKRVFRYQKLIIHDLLMLNIDNYKAAADFIKTELLQSVDQDAEIFDFLTDKVIEYAQIYDDKYSANLAAVCAIIIQQTQDVIIGEIGQSILRQVLLNKLQYLFEQHVVSPYQDQGAKSKLQVFICQLHLQNIVPLVLIKLIMYETLLQISQYGSINNYVNEECVFQIINILKLVN